jgi:hypothetical protein
MEDLQTTFDLIHLVIPFGHIQKIDLVSLSVSTPLLKYVACCHKLQQQTIDLYRLKINDHFLVVEDSQLYWAIVDTIHQYPSGQNEICFSIVYLSQLDYTPTNIRYPGACGKVYFSHTYFSPHVIMACQNFQDDLKTIVVDPSEQIYPTYIYGNEVGFPCFNIDYKDFRALCQKYHLHD